MTKRKTILIDAREWSSSTGRYTRQLVHYLQEVDNNHNYILLQKSKDIDSWEPSNKHFQKIVTHFREFTFGEQVGLLWQIMKLKPDLVHFLKVEQPVLYPGRVVTTMQDLTTMRFTNPSKNLFIFKFKQHVYKWVNLIVVRKSVALITPTEFVKDDVARTLRVNSRKITVTLEAGDIISAKPESLEEFAGKQFIMYVGRPQPHKNLGRLVDAFAVLKQTYPDLQLVLVGKTDVLYRRLKRETSHKGVPDVIFTGLVNDSQLKWLYEHCLAYVFPSLSEGFGLPGLEAMANGAPVVSSNATCLPEVHGDAAHYFDPLDVQDMATKITEVIDSEKLRQKLIAAGYTQVKKFSWRRMAEQTLAVYERALGEK